MCSRSLTAVMIKLSTQRQRGNHNNGIALGSGSMKDFFCSTGERGIPAFMQCHHRRGSSPFIFISFLFLSPFCKIFPIPQNPVLNQKGSGLGTNAHTLISRIKAFETSWKADSYDRLFIIRRRRGSVVLDHDDEKNTLLTNSVQYLNVPFAFRQYNKGY